ncbi:hypothetical protein MJO28_009811 [Puccinia striiformis f. sp. tritici]|uniref:Uncharacterized protein n=1 Tax=Puccinia striiformis f. sp. tritici TaxID=168172 RepID=A0ACC0E8K3_9BASI|nr:hypothetical protein Pst134EA_017349 [Puccinia striiformis f. sp. tritici]KAI9615385.1 hypothetical protein KEM48_005676 [Puccinia striiformis f. sp. tritici PST-130]KAH9450745.1 hypothetical protein Pst134EB_018265 [Puccinia striiformis f. sp. tritici]KAH9461040.1 hypothetical protein Pst134EA_017349 [Puccinia striiformis f. sp. tritici]KAI7947903.1 hypothetical protein MJO28_009811 [Puccinia striiformis f. sp. tritici]KAI7950903.1 hypothetical protein MJO29_009577 [Puccinia striiformis f.
MFGLGNILYVSLLLINSLAILNEDRFLARIGWSTKQINHVQFQDPSIISTHHHQAGSVKERLINLIGAVRTLMRIPLIAINVLVIIYELILG